MYHLSCTIMSLNLLVRYFVTIIQQDRARFGGTQAEMNLFIQDLIQNGSGENGNEADNSSEEGENEGDITLV